MYSSNCRNPQESSIETAYRVYQNFFFPQSFFFSVKAKILAEVVLTVAGILPSSQHVKFDSYYGCYRVCGVARFLAGQGLNDANEDVRSLSGTVLALIEREECLRRLNSLFLAYQASCYQPGF